MAVPGFSGSRSVASASGVSSSAKNLEKVILFYLLFSGQYDTFHIFIQQTMVQ